MLLAIVLAASVVPPAGWTAKKLGDVTTFSPPASGGLALIEAHPAEAAKDTRAWVESAWRALKKPYSGVMDESINEQRNPAGLLSVTAAASMQDSSGRALFVVLYGVGDGARVQPVLFVGGSLEAYRSYADLATRMVNQLSAIDPPGKGSFVARLHPFFGGAGAQPVASAPPPAPAPPAGAPAPVLAPEGSDSDYRQARHAGLYIADHKVIADGVDVALVGEWREDLKEITLRLKRDNTYALRTGASAIYANGNTGTFSHATAGQGIETGRWSISNGVLTLTPSNGQASGVSGYGAATRKAVDPGGPRAYRVTGVTIQYTPLDTNLTRTRPGLHLRGPAQPGMGADWDVILRSAPPTL